MEFEEQPIMILRPWRHGVVRKSVGSNPVSVRVRPLTPIFFNILGASVITIFIHDKRWNVSGI